MNESRLDEALAVPQALRIRRRQRGDARSRSPFSSRTSAHLVAQEAVPARRAAITRALEVATAVGAKRCTAESFQDLCYAYMQMKKYSVATLHGERASRSRRERYHDVEKNATTSRRERPPRRPRRGARPSLDSLQDSTGAAAPARFSLCLRPERHHHPETMTTMIDQTRRLPVSPIRPAGRAFPPGRRGRAALPARAATRALSPPASSTASPRSPAPPGSAVQRRRWSSSGPVADATAQAWVLRAPTTPSWTSSRRSPSVREAVLPAVAWSRPDAAGYQIFVSSTTEPAGARPAP